MKIVINGAGIAGTTLAWWLRRSGHEVVLVEAAPGPRRGGYVVDFWGVGYAIAERMGIIGRIRELGYMVREVRLVDRRGRRRGGFDVAVFGRLTGGRFTSVRRSDIAETIRGALDGGVETIFGDSVAAIEDAGARVRVRFDHAAPHEADLVVGADGQHSRVRALAFGPERDFARSLGYHIAAFELEGYRPRDELVYVTHGVPGRQVSRFSMRGDRTLVLFIFRDEYLGTPPGPDDAARRAALRRAFAGVGWECPRIHRGEDAAGEIYFDSVSQIRMPRWTKGRVALVGDAAACVSLLAGEGTGLAMAEAYVLAGELGVAPHDPAAALDRYHARMAAFVERKQGSALRFAAAFAPRSATGIAMRNVVTRLFAIPGLADWLIGRELRDDIELPEY